MYQFESSLQILCKLWNFFNKNATLDQEYVAKDIEFNRNENEKMKKENGLVQMEKVFNPMKK